MNTNETNYRKIGTVAAIAIAIAAMIIPGAGLASTVLADKGGKVSDSGNVVQSIDQSNSISASNSGNNGQASADHNTQSNSAANIADVDIHNHGGGKVKDSGNVAQVISQSNSITAANTANGGSASADFNTQSNEAANVANVDISNHGGYHGGKIKDSGNVAQIIAQDNSITATNSPPPTLLACLIGINCGSASADHNTQSNSAANIADVDIHNHGGGKVKDSGNVAQIIAQANSIIATNTGNSGSASADFNTQNNAAANLADVDISNHGGYHGGKIKDSSNVAQIIAQANSIIATNTGFLGSASADFNFQNNTAANLADVDIHNHENH